MDKKQEVQKTASEETLQKKVGVDLEKCSEEEFWQEVKYSDNNQSDR